MGHSFHHQPAMRERPDFIESNSDPELERHIETRCARFSAVQLNSGEIVDRVMAALNQIENAIQAAPATRDFQRDAGNHAKGMNGGDISKEEIFVIGIVGNVEENFSASVSLCHASAFFEKHCEIWRLIFCGQIGPRGPAS